jgi:hypothetical protein
LNQPYVGNQPDAVALHEEEVDLVVVADFLTDGVKLVAVVLMSRDVLGHLRE